MKYLWELMLFAICSLSLVAIWRSRPFGLIATWLAFYVFFQVSSAYFLIPFNLYKDGGNGAGLLDFPIWIGWATVACFVEFGVYLITKRFLRIIKAGD